MHLGALRQFTLFYNVYISAVKKKVHSLAQKKNCEDVNAWEQSVNHHVYWIAASTTDEKDMRLARWTSLTNHMQGVHHGHSGIFPRCLHSDLKEG